MLHKKHCTAQENKPGDEQNEQLALQKGQREKMGFLTKEQEEFFKGPISMEELDKLTEEVMKQLPEIERKSKEKLRKRKQRKSKQKSAKTNRKVRRITDFMINKSARKP